MKFKGCLLVTILSLSLQSCASWRADLSDGKAYFEAGRYREAFHRLLPVAAVGRKEAEYAVGYMYYYGYGTQQDAESGIFWITKSADQHYSPAVQALKMIQQSNLPAQQNVAESESPQQVGAQNPRVTVRDLSSDPVMQSLHAKSVASGEKQYPSFQSRAEHSKALAAVVHPEVPAKSESRKITLREGGNVSSLGKRTEKKSPAYTLQLFGSYHLADTEKLKSHLAYHNMYVWKTQHNDKDWYVLTYGHYQDAHHALLAKQSLPEKLGAMSPWARSTGTLKYCVSGC